MSSSSRRRWAICALLFAATAINYVDRQMIGVLKPVLQADLGWTEAHYADIVFWFQAAYAVGFIVAGRVIDRLGTRLGYAIYFTVWTAAHIAHGVVSTVTQFAAVRVALGLGEAGNFPAGAKAVAEWFPQRERAFAIGLFNAGANVGALMTPMIVPLLVVAYGWRTAFVATGLVSLLWLGAWLIVYPRRPPVVSVAVETDTGAGSPARRWRDLLRVRATWAYATAKFMTDPVWWMFLFWLPDFLHKRHGLDILSVGPPLFAIYLLSDMGSVAGGWTSSRLMRFGWSPNAARKVTMLGCAVLATPIIVVQHVDQLWLAVLLLGIAMAAHQGFSANLLTLPSDLFPMRSVGSVIGIGGAAGAVGGMLVAKFVGYVLGVSGSYATIFVMAGCAYLVALGALHLLSPRLAPADVG